MNYAKCHSIVLPDIKISDEDLIKCTRNNYNFAQELCEKVKEFAEECIDDEVKRADSAEIAKETSSKLQKLIKSIMK